VRLLLDQNLSRRLVPVLDDAFPGIAHVASAGLDRASDETVWVYAGHKGLAIVTKDADFVDLSTLRGAPPKVIWLRIGNCTTGQIATLLVLHQAAIKVFLDEPSLRVLTLM
jgi:predicted nuclease of predicted toxin-antitoxin system